MTTSFTIENTFPSISLEKFVAHLNDPKLNSLLEKELSFDERTMTQRIESNNGNLEWHFLVRKKGELPTAIKKIIPGDGLAWHEVSRFVAKENCIYWEIKPESKLVKFHGEGTWQLSKSGKGCKRIIEGKVSVEIPFVGKVVESFIVSELKSTYEVEPKIQEKFYRSIA
jgi:hypothetical protein